MIPHAVFLSPPFFAAASAALRVKAIVCLATFALLALAPAQAQTSGKIAFSSTRVDRNSEIFVMNADGTGKQRLTYHLDADTEPALSPDGSKVAFISSRNSFANYAKEVFVVNVDGSGLRQLTALNLTSSRPIWSPDGSRVAFAALNLSIPSSQPSVYVVDAAGGTPVNVTAGRPAQWLTLNGVSRIVLTKTGAGNNQNSRYNCNPDGSDVQLGPNANRSGTTLSPDGTLEVGTGARDETTRQLYLYVRRASDGSTLLEKDLPVGLTDFAWSPDRQSIVAQGFAPTGSSLPTDIYRINLDGTGLARLTVTPEPDARPTWAPGATVPVAPPPTGNGRILFSTGTEVFSVNPAGWDVRHVIDGTEDVIDGTNFTNLITQPTWSGDGSRIAVRWPQSNRVLGQTSLLTAAPDGSARLEIAEPANAPGSNRIALNHDGSRFIFGGERVFGEDRYIGLHQHDTSNNDSTVPQAGYFLRPDPNSPGFYTTVGLQHGLTEPSWTKGTQDQRLTYIRRDGGYTNWLMTKVVGSPFGTGQSILERGVPVNGSDGITLSSPRWNPAGTQITFVQSEVVGNSGKINVMTISAAGGEPAYVTSYPFGSGRPIYDPSFSPTGTEIVFLRDGVLFIINADGAGFRRLAETGAGFDGVYNGAGRGTINGVDWGANNDHSVADTVAPSLTISAPAAGEPTALRLVGGVVGDTAAGEASGVAIVWVTLKRASDGRYWNSGAPERWTTARALLGSDLAVLDPATPGVRAWSCKSADLGGSLPAYAEIAAGSYEIAAFPIDDAGNAGAEMTRTVQVIKPGILQLSSESFTINEATNAPLSGSLAVLRTGGTDGTISVEYIFASSGSATADADYRSAGGTLTFAPGEASKTIPLPVINDALLEPGEDFRVQLQNPSALTVLGAVKAATLSIEDDDTGTFRLASASPIIVREDAGNAIVVIERTGGSAAASVNVQGFPSGEPLPAADFNQTITFAAGETRKEIAIPLLNDAATSSTRSIDVQFYQPNSNQRGSTLVNVLDDETIAAQGAFGFERASYTLGAGDLGIRIIRTGSSAGRVVTYSDVDTSAPGSAQQGTDFQFFGGSRVFPSGDSFPQELTVSKLPGATPGTSFRVFLRDASYREIAVTTVTLSGGGSGGTPTASTGAATNLTQTGAKLNGTVNSNGAATTARFEYGLTTSYGQQTASQNIASGSSAKPVSASVTGLEPNTPYHFRLVAGGVAGADAIFTTGAAQPGSGPTSGTMVLSATSGVVAGDRIQVSFAGWIDKDKPLSFGVALDGVEVVPPGKASTVTITAPATLGTHTVIGGILDKLGNFTEVTRTFAVVAAPAAPVATELFASNTAMPASTGVPGGRWLGFGIPNALPDGNVGFGALFTNADGLVYLGIFGGPHGSPGLLLPNRGPATDANGELLARGEFESFREPVFSGPDQFAVEATLSGVPKGTESGIWARIGSALRLVAREGDPAPGISGAKFSGFTSIANAPGKVFLTATVKGGGVTAASDFGLWTYDVDNGLGLVVREGSDVPLGPGDTRKVKRLQVLAPRAGSPGEAGAVAGEVALLLTFSDGSQAQATAAQAPEFDIRRLTGQAVNDAPATTSFSMHDLLAFGSDYTSLARFSDKTFAVVNQQSGTVARTRAEAPGTGAVFKSFGLPVIGFGNGSTDTAFFATITGSGYSSKNDGGIWLQKDTLPVALLTREGNAAPGTGGATFKDFTSLSVMAGRGPVFVAKLKTGTGAPKTSGKTDLGVWAQSGTGALVKLLREGDALGSKIVQTFQVLVVVAGSPGQGRAFGSREDMLARVFFTDGSHAIVKIDVP